MISYKSLFFINLVIFLSLAFSQTKTDKVFVDNGILKWSDSQKEVALFGVNYSTPFAHSYRSIKKLGLSHKKAIDLDVSQFARLELEAYRIHVWDREVSDSLGNLLQNEHLDLLDYLIYRLKEKNIYTILTPIAWWGTGWPEPDLQTPGFSSKNSKSELITKPAARKAQANYLTQFLNHTNKYTDMSYKDDPDIIAFEIINEPGHPADTAMVTEYINEMAAVFRDQGVTKPIYYNISQNWSADQAAAVYKADIDGISFQWYPTGLVKNSELTGNYLAHVDHYPVPKINDAKFNNKTRMVYEFDAADVAQSVMYPAMARSFREAGMQWATMFCYDPTFLAAFNTEYNTHYVNLVYTPQKAISLMIAANVFRSLKTYQEFPSYPQNTQFNDFTISYVQNLSQLNNGEKFYYSSSTSSQPKNPEKLRHIAGYGSSELVRTNARGAYFIDKIAKNTWRLELYPDVAKLKNPFGRNSLDSKVRVLLNNSSSFTLNLPGLNKSFFLFPVTEKGKSSVIDNGVVSIKPGVYIISNKEWQSLEGLSFGYRNISLIEYPVYPFSRTGEYVINHSPNQVADKNIWKPTFQIISDSPVDTAILFIKQPGWRGFRPVPLNHVEKDIYAKEIKEGIHNGFIEYCLYFRTVDGEITYPAKIKKNPNAWDYYGDQTWKLKILPENASFSLFNPADDLENLIFPGFWGKFRLNSSVIWDQKQNPWYNLELFDFRQQVDDFTFQIELDDKTDLVNMSDFSFIEFEINPANSTVKEFKFQLINSAYEVIEKDITISADSRLIRIPLKEFSIKEFVLLPRPYPHFLPYYFKTNAGKLSEDSKKLCFIQIQIPFKNKMESIDRLSLQFNKIRLIK